MNGPLRGVRVLDLSRVLAGPWATQLLADMGAEVVKIERPDAGDDTRGWGPPFLTHADGSKGDAAYFHATNRGKKSVALDLASPQGQEAVRDLAQSSDILVENFKAGALAKYGLDYTALAKVNPGLIYCSITGFGQDGPYADRPGYDFLLQAMGGLMSVTGDPDGAGGHPLKLGVAISDLMTGMYTAAAVLGALHHRTRTGEGQHIDLALFDATVAMLANQNMNYLIGGKVPGRLGNAHPNIVPYQDFATADGHVILAVGNDGQFEKFCRAVGRADLWERAEYRSNEGRAQHRETLVPEIAAIFRERNTAEWIADLNAAGVPCGPINTVADVFADPQIRHREVLRHLHHPGAGEVPSVANPIRYSRTPMDYDAASPLLGQHTDEILNALSGDRAAKKRGPETS